MRVTAAQLLKQLLATIAVVAISGSTCLAETFRLAADAGQSLQVRSVIDIEGELKTNADGKEVQRLPVTVAAEQLYLERPLPMTGGAVRYYRESKADIELGKAKVSELLREDRRHLVLFPSDDRPQLYSPLGPLSREELELVETPAALIQLIELLPDREVELGDDWAVSDETLARLLCLEVIHKQDVSCKLAKVENGVATVSLSGKASGAIEGVSSDVELIAKYNFDLSKKVITWLALAIRENRAIGHAQPGFETVTKVRLVAAPVSSPVELSDKSLAGLSLQPGSGDTFLELRSAKGGYELLHDRRWRVMVDRHDVAVMRLIDRGDLIAQCNVARLQKLPAGEQLTVHGFQEDVKKTLGKNFGQIVEASEQVNDSGIHVLRVVASGNASDLPIQWTYYHLANEKGERASIVLTIEASLVERFAAVDRELISGFRFLEQSDKSATPAAEERSQPTAQKASAAAKTR